MDHPTKERLLSEFDGKSSAYNSLASYSQRLLADLLRVERLNVLSIADRVKARDSLSEKLSRPGKHYENLQEVTDLVGLRVVTFFEDEVDIVAAIVAKEFELLSQYCVDRRSFAEPDRFGYKSLHYVCKLAKTRRELTETGAYCDELFEIQIRSILQHAWAEIEHIGYKSEIAIPNEIRHRMSRVAGLLEIADREFMEVRDESLAYKEKVAAEIRKQALLNIELNSISYLEFIATSPLVRDLNEFIGNDLKLQIDTSADPDEDFLVECLRSVNIASIASLQDELQANFLLLKAFAKLFLCRQQEESDMPMGPAISIFHLAQLVALKLGGVDRLAGFYEHHGIIGIGDSRESAEDTAATVAQAEANLLRGNSSFTDAQG